MATVIHHFKDGTVTEDISNVYVPAEIMRNIARIAAEREKAREMERKESK